MIVQVVNGPSLEGLRDGLFQGEAGEERKATELTLDSGDGSIRGPIFMFLHTLERLGKGLELWRFKGISFSHDGQPQVITGEYNVRTKKGYVEF